MAGDWIKVEEAMPDKPEVFAIATELNLDPDAVVGKLIRVWSWASRSCHGDGVTPSSSAHAIDRAAGTTGFAKAMINCGWLLQKNDCLQFPRFDRHNSKTAKERGLTFIRQQRARAKKRHDSVTPLSRSRHASGVTKETENRDRDKGEESPLKTPSCSEPSKTTTPEPPAEFPIFECNGREGQRRWRLTDDEIRSLAEAFPAVAVQGECRKAWKWLDANPAKRKTARGMSSFLFRWMERAQNDNRSQTPIPRGRPPSGRQTVAEHNADAFREVFGDDDDDDGIETKQQASPAPQGLL